MKTIVPFLIILLLFFNFGSVAQTKGVINYLYTVNDLSNPQSRIPLNYSVFFIGNQSLQLTNKIKVKDEELLTKENTDLSKYVSTKSTKPTFVLKDFTTKTLIYSELISINRYLVKDTLNNFQWKITSEKKKILSFDRIKATTFFRVRNYEAWFTESIPLPNGPWKFGGLPGLIIEVYDSENKHNFKLTGIDLQADIDINLIKTPIEYVNDKQFNYDELMNYYNKKVIELAAASRVVTITENSTSSSSYTLAKRLELY